MKSSLSRRKLLLSATAVLLADYSLSPISAIAFAEDRLAAAAKAGRQFLADLLDPELNLLPEFRGASIYWLYHDNYLASKVLARSHPEISQKIIAAIKSFGVTESGKIEIVFDEAKKPLPFRNFELKEVRTIGKKVLKTERTTQKISAGWEKYADLRFLTAIALAKSDPSQAKANLDAGYQTWDGTGFNDCVVAVHNRYATYKLALALIAASKLDQRPKAADAVLDRLLSLQAKNGDWITDFDAKGKPVGLANVETTSLAILALETL